MEQVILVDGQDNELGYEEKYACHKIPSRLHRAISVFIFNNKNELLVQKRSSEKKTWPSFWSNTVCSHPRPDEPPELAAKRRLEEELGFSCDIEHIFHFIYKADYDKTWGENEFDHVFIGQYDGPVKPNPDEIDEIKFVAIDQLKKDVENHPEKYTPWFKMCMNRVLSHVAKQ